MAKTYTPVGWEDGEIIIPAMANLTTGEVTPAQVSGTTPVNADNLKHMDDAIKDLYDEGTTSKDIVIGTEEETTEDTKLLIETDSLASLGTEVVDSLDGNETNMAPSVRAVKNFFKLKIVEVTSSSDQHSGTYYSDIYVEPYGITPNNTLNVSGDTLSGNPTFMYQWIDYKTIRVRTNESNHDMKVYILYF